MIRVWHWRLWDTISGQEVVWDSIVGLVIHHAYKLYHLSVFTGRLISSRDYLNR